MVKNKRNALGKGLSALLEDAGTDITSKDNISVNSISQIFIHQIEANPFQPRTEFEEDKLNELAESIKVHGIIQPITVRKLGYDKYQIISGERRTRASILAGLSQIPAYIRIADDQDMLEMALIENIQRAELNAIEIALSYQRLMLECKLKQEELGNRVGKKRSTVANYLRLLKLPDEAQIAIKNGQITMGHARTIISLKEESDQLALLQRIIDDNISVRKAEAIVKYSKKPQGKATKEDISIPTRITYLSNKYGIGLKLTEAKNGKGKIVLSYDDDEKYNKIIDLLSNV